ncbi:MAG: guanylate kinase [Acidimicrobiia bacterium]|nr:guanylate kinase [Acidimicrobiia bacterium]
MSDSAKLSSTNSAEETPGRLFVVAGPSGVGKDTLIRELVGRWPFYLSVSATTRHARPGEVDGRDYIFLSDEEFTRWVEEDRFLEWAEFSEQRYGTPRESVEAHLAAGADVLVEVEVQGAMQIKERKPEATFVFIEPPSMEELEARLARRGDTQDIEARLDRARVEMSLADEFDYRVVNEVLADAVAELLSVVAHSEGSQNDQTAD